MMNFIKLLGVVAVTVIIPLVVLLGIWADILPQSLQVAIGLGAVALSIAFIVFGNVMLMYGDLKTGRYSAK